MAASPLLAAALSAFDVGLTLVGGGTSVINGVNSALGIVAYETTPEMDIRGVKGAISGTCKVKASDIGALSYAQTVKIGTRTVFVTYHRTDAIGAVTTFNFSSTSPVEALQ